MTESTFEKAYILRDKISKLISAKNKLKHEFPEWEHPYDDVSRWVGMKIMEVIEQTIGEAQDEFKKL